MKILIKTLSIFLLLTIFMTGFNASYTSLNLDNLAIVIALGIDTSDNKTMTLNFQFSKPSSSGSSSSTSSSSLIYSIETDSISDGINLMNTYLEKELTFSHCKVIAFSSEYSKNGISDEIYTLLNDPQFRPSSKIVITNTSTKEYLQHSQPVSQNALSDYYDIFTASSQFTGYSANTTIGDFLYSLESDFNQPYAILGNISSETSIVQASDTSTSSESNTSKTMISENLRCCCF